MTKGVNVLRDFNAEKQCNNKIAPVAFVSRRKDIQVKKKCLMNSQKVTQVIQMAIELKFKTQLDYKKLFETHIKKARSKKSYNKQLV